MKGRNAGCRLVGLAAAFSLLAACGGGGGGGAAPASSVISGTAASGAPIIGQVTVKDAEGTMRVVDIDSSGKYSVNVSGLVAPFVFRAQGKVGGREVRLTSAATAADINGNINITPFTDLMVANIAGQLASAYFDSGSFSAMSDVELNAAKTQLTARLQPILGELGVDAGFDLLRTAFAADHSGFDAVMDVVRVTVDESTSKALIEDIVNGNSIEDDLTSISDATVIAAPAPGSLTGAITDLEALEAKMAVFNTLFKTQAPDPDDATLRTIFGDSATFLDDGQNLDSFLNELTSETWIVGARMVNPVIVDYVDANTLTVAFALVEADGWVGQLEMRAKKVDGSWLLNGNQHWIDFDVDPVNVRRLGYNDDPQWGVYWLPTTTYFRIIDTYVDWAPADAFYVKVSGDGLAQPLLLHRSATQTDNFVIVKTDGATDTTGSWLRECGEEDAGDPCIDFSQVTANSTYTVELLDAGKQAIVGKDGFTTRIKWLPFSNAEAQAHASEWFGKVASITPANPASIGNGTTITATLTMPTAQGHGFDGFAYSDYINGVWLESWNMPGAGKTVDLTWASSVAPTHPEYYFWTYSLAGAVFLTVGEHRAPAVQ